MLATNEESNPPDKKNAIGLSAFKRIFTAYIKDSLIFDR